MKKQNKAVGVITAILATFLSIFFVIFTLAAVLTGTVASLVKPANVVQVVQNIDYTQILLEDESVSAMIEELDIDPQVVNEFMQSKAVAEIVGVYAESISAALTGKEIPEGLTVDKLLAIADEHLDEIVDIVQDVYPMEITKEEVSTQLKTLISDNAESIVASLPTAQELSTQIIEVESMPYVQMLFGSTVTTVLAIVAAVLAALIYACRFRRFGGMLWIGIDSIVAAAFVGLFCVATGVVKSMLAGMAGSAGVAVESGITVFSGGLTIALLVLLAVGVVLIVGCILLRKYCCKPKAAAEAPVQPEELPAPEQFEQPEQPETPAE